MWQLEYSNIAAKQISELPTRDKSKVGKALELLVTNPDLGKQLVGPLKGLRSYRIGKYRIIYKKENAYFVILIVAVGLRKNIYLKR